MIQYVDSAFANAIWGALTSETSIRIVPRDDKMVAASLRSGWMRLEDLEYFVRDRDYRLTAAFSALNREKFVTGFGYSPVHIFKRENVTLKPLEASFGSPALRIADAAKLLIDLEAIGFEVDPSGLVDAIIPTLKGNEILTDQELSVLWYRRQHLKVPHSFQVRGPRGITKGSGPNSLKLATGHKIEAYLWGDGSVHWFSIRPPKYRSSRQRVA